MRMGPKAGAAGFTLIELLVSLVIGSMLITSLFKLWQTNQSETNRIQSKVDYRDRFTIATTAVNRSITMAGFGMSKMNVIVKATGSFTDTLTLYSNESERRTTLRDTALAGHSSMLVFKDSGFVEGCLIGITDSLRHEYVRVSSMSGDSSAGFRLEFSPALRYTYAAGVPNIYPVKREIFFIDGTEQALIKKVDDDRVVLATGMKDFRIDLRDGSGLPATSCQSIRVVTFSLMGTYKAPAGTPNQMRFSSTVIPRNIL
ncbi:MAG: prepilin-type N-terminal cleavage/methylation domain-containing protein [Fibrobacterota bacterium]|nr:prepilin-type N-terminal cleavage/methylation domain-containing protein [Fibrobacterota bacterium]